MSCYYLPNSTKTPLQNTVRRRRHWRINGVWVWRFRAAPRAARAAQS